jgi:hypothetical protein
VSALVIVYSKAYSGLPPLHPLFSAVSQSTSSCTLSGICFPPAIRTWASTEEVATNAQQAPHSPCDTVRIKARQDKTRQVKTSYAVEIYTILLIITSYILKCSLTSMKELVAAVHYKDYFTAHLISHDR